MIIQGISYPSDFEAKKGMIEVGRRMAEKSFVIAGEGSLSVRVGPNAVWFSVENAEKGALKQDSFIRVDLNGKQTPGTRNVRLPEDASVHLQLYSQNPDLRCVIHAYPPGAVALAAKGEGVEPMDYTPAVRKLGRLKLVPGCCAQDAASEAVLSCKTDSGVLIAKDGCLMWGTCLQEVFHRLEAVEYYVKLRRMLCGANRTESGCGSAQGGRSCASVGTGCQSSTAAAGAVSQPGCVPGYSAAPAVSTSGASGVPARPLESGCVPAFEADPVASRAAVSCGPATPIPAGFVTAASTSSPAVSAVAAAALSKMEGLTAVIRPGDAFPAPAPASGPAASSPAGKKAAPTAGKAVSAAAGKSVMQVQTRPAAMKAQVQPARTAQAASRPGTWSPVRPAESRSIPASARPVGGLAKAADRQEEGQRTAKRQEMMAEVVRRSLTAM